MRNLSHHCVAILAFMAFCGSATADPGAGLVQPNSGGPLTTYTCDRDNGTVTGRVLSSKAIYMRGYECKDRGYGSNIIYGSTQPVRMKHHKGVVTMNVQLADPADASKMQPGRVVTLAGLVRVTRGRDLDYLTVTDAKVLYADPFAR